MEYYISWQLAFTLGYCLNNTPNLSPQPAPSSLLHLLHTLGLWPLVQTVKYSVGGPKLGSILPLYNYKVPVLAATLEQLVVHSVSGERLSRVTLYLYYS